MKKKGFIYSLIVLLFVLLFVSSIIFSGKSSKRESSYSQSMVIKNLDNKFDYAKIDISRGIYIVGLRSLLAMNDIISSSGNYITDIDLTFHEIFFYGTYNDEEIEIMDGTNFHDFKNNFESSLLNDNIVLEIEIHNVSIEMNSPWYVTANLNATLFFSDIVGTASWKDEFIISSDISIYELNDPLYVVSSNGFVINQIRKTNITNYVFGTNVSNLIYHMENSLYTESNTAPNYLMRLQGIILPNEHGIESLINYDKFAIQAIPFRNRTAVDYIYLSNNPIISEYKIQGMPNWFMLDEDDNHINKYGVGSLIIT